MVKLLYCLRRRADMSFDQFGAYWSGPHAALVSRHAPVLGILRYVQSHAIAPDANTALQANRQTLQAYDGVAEIYFKDLSTMAEANLTAQAQAAQAELTADEDKFIDRSCSVLFVAQEHVVIGDTSA